MASTINASTSSGLVNTADTSGVLQLQTANTTALTISAAQVVTLANPLPAASGGTGSTTSTGSGAVVLATSPTITTPTINQINTSVANTSLGAGNASIMKNRIINGAMVIDQRNAGASVTPTASAYTLDRWYANISQSSKFSVQQNAGSVTTPTGFNNYLGITSLSAYSIGATDYFILQQAIEGFNTADLGWGTANAKTVTLSFQIYSSLTGTFGGTISSGASQRAYPFTYTVSSANTWTSINVTIAGDTGGTWNGATNGVGVIVRFGLGVGSTYSATAGSWTSTNFIFSATGATSVVGTNGATFYITGVQLEVGSSATGFEYRLYNQELSACQRYFQTVGGVASGSNQKIGPAASYSTTIQDCSVAFSPTMRATPTLTAPSGTNYYTMYSNGGGYGFNSVTITDASTQAVGIRGNAGVPANGCGWFNWGGAPAGSILGFSAEL